MLYRQLQPISPQRRYCSFGAWRVSRSDFHILNIIIFSNLQSVDTLIDAHRWCAHSATRCSKIICPLLKLNVLMVHRVNILFNHFFHSVRRVAVARTLVVCGCTELVTSLGWPSERTLRSAASWLFLLLRRILIRWPMLHLLSLTLRLVGGGIWRRILLSCLFQQLHK